MNKISSFRLKNEIEVYEQNKIYSHPHSKLYYLVKTIFSFFDIKKFIGSIIGKKILSVKIDRKVIEKNLLLIDELIRAQLVTKFKAKNSKAEIDGIIIKPDAVTLSDKWMLVCNGIGDCFEKHVPALHKLAKDANINIVTYNYSGIENSIGKITSKKSLVDNGLLVLDYLFDAKNVQRENLLIYGHSLGGGVAALIEAELRQEFGQSVPLISESSFYDFSTAAAMKGGIIAKISAFFIRFSHFNLVALEAFKACEKKGLLVNRADPIVRHQASLYKALKKEKHLPTPTSVFHLIKTGVNPQYETFKSKNVTYLHPTNNQKVKVAKTMELKNQSFDYQNKWKQIRKNKALQKHLVFPHDRVMDRVLFEQTLPKNPQDQLLVKSFQEKFHAEDVVAYQYFVTMVKALIA